MLNLEIIAKVTNIHNKQLDMHFYQICMLNLNLILLQVIKVPWNKHKELKFIDNVTLFEKHKSIDEIETFLYKELKSLSKKGTVNISIIASTSKKKQKGYVIRKNKLAKDVRKIVSDVSNFFNRDYYNINKKTC